MFHRLQHGIWLAVLIAVVPAMLGTPAHAFQQSVDGIWSALPDSVSAPSDRREYVAIYDQANNRYLLFGGFGFGSTAPENNYNEVWTLTLGDNPTWSLLDIAGTPPGPRKGSQWGYDIARNRLLIFGGYGQHDVYSAVNWLNDVWQLSLDGASPTWTELNPTGEAPSPRLEGVAVYDPMRQRFVGFGGVNGGLTYTWGLDLSVDPPQWITLDTGAQLPPGGYGQAGIYDPVRDRMLMFGGSTGWDYFGAQNNLWEMTLTDSTVWHQLSAGGPLPKARRTMGSFFDPLRDRMVIFGGWDALSNEVSSSLNDVWALPLAEPLQWQQLQPAGTIPIVRDAIVSVYDPTHDRMVIYGGWAGDHMLGDTEYLTWGELPTHATITAGAPAATTHYASVNWNVSQSTGVHAAVFRSGPNQPWSSIGMLTINAQGGASFTDHNVVPGTQYSYELGVSSERGPSVGGQVAVNVPLIDVPPQVDVAFALQPVRPNPLVDRFKVSFSLPNADPARIDVMDVSGRRMLTREVGSLGAGSHELDLGGACAFTPGMYFVRLSRAGQTLTTRAVVLSGLK